MRYCPANESLLPVWTSRGGLSLCFLDTVGPPVLLLLMLVGGGLQGALYLRHATRLDARLLRRTGCYRLHTSLMTALGSSCLVRLAVSSWLAGGSVEGHQLVWALCLAPAWFLAVLVTRLERHWALPSVPTHGHGLPLLLFWAAGVVHEALAFLGLHSPHWWFGAHSSRDIADVAFFAMRFVLSVLVFGIGLRGPSVPSSQDYFLYARAQGHLQEAQPLLEEGGDGEEARRSPWRGVGAKVRLLLPFLWPRRSPRLQGLVLLCLLLLAAGRVVNLFVPMLNRAVVNSLAGRGQLVFPWQDILLYVLLWCLQGQGGSSLLSSARSFLWIYVQQFTVREVQVELYAHLHGLSMSWHLGRKTGEVLKVLDRGTNSVTSLLSYILFNIVPAVADIVVAIVYFTVSFNAWFGLVVFVTMALYLAATVALTEWRTKFRREMNLLDNAAQARGVDALLNFETVKYYNAEDYEVAGYRECIEKYQVAEWRVNASLSLLNGCQTLLIALGVAAGALLCAHMVAAGHQGGLTVGDYVLFLTYVMQLYTPLNFLGTYYRMIQRSFIDMENMFELLDTKPEVIDAVNAPSLKLAKGEIRFDNVCFSYLPERPILKSVSFVVPPGRTVALVGPSGSGKTTIVRLLFRLYDVQEGSITIDGQDVSRVKQKSLRQAIGVVPQDTVLFNKDIRYNIRYGRVDATDAEVEDAARAAELHQQIMGSFPRGYDTVVGERGLKLSGGEKQRVAIARSILKGPVIMLLDEATSALDTQTERNIQASLDLVCRNRTTLVVAHRLSTVIHADQILVLQEGEIVESGSHEELLEYGGTYASMWQQQQQRVGPKAPSDEGPPPDP